MNDQDYIKEGVELAGWLEVDEEGEYLQIPDTPTSSYLDEIIATCDQYLLDALAAQLARQVDALTDYSGVRVCPNITEIFHIAGQPHIPVTGPDRTMNTIKAIVDSKALEA